VPASYSSAANDELVHDPSNTSIDLSAPTPALQPIEHDTVIVSRHPTRQVKRPARFAKFVMKIHCNYPCMFQRTMKVKRFSSRRQYRCDQCEVTRKHSYRRHLGSKEHQARAPPTVITPSELPDSSDVSSTITPAADADADAVVIDSTTDDDVERTNKPVEHYNKLRRRWCYRCSLSDVVPFCHQHVKKHLDNSPGRKRRRIDQTLGEVDTLVVHFQAARYVSLVVRDLLKNGEDCNIERVTDMMMSEVGAVRREPMQLLATGILSGVHSCLGKTFLRPSSPVENRAPAVVGTVYCRRTLSPAKGIEVPVGRYVPVCSDISNMESPECNSHKVDRFLPLVEVNLSDFQSIDEVDFAVERDSTERRMFEDEDMDPNPPVIDI